MVYRASAWKPQLRSRRQSEAGQGAPQVGQVPAEWAGPWVGVSKPVPPHAAALTVQQSDATPSRLRTCDVERGDITVTQHSPPLGPLPPSCQSQSVGWGGMGENKKLLDKFKYLHKWTIPWKPQSGPGGVTFNLSSPMRKSKSSERKII